MLAQTENPHTSGPEELGCSWREVCVGYDLSKEPQGGRGHQGAWGPGHPAGGSDILSSLVDITLAESQPCFPVTTLASISADLLQKGTLYFLPLLLTPCLWPQQNLCT